MGETVYADILFFINFSMDFLCFYICSRVLGRPLACLRAALASAMGGVYSVAMLIWCPDGIVSLLLDISVLLLMCAVAQPNGSTSLAGKFGGAAMYAGISAALGGFMTAVYSLANRAGLSGNVSGTELGVSDGGMSAWVFALIASSGAAAAVIGGRRLRLRSSGERMRVTVNIGGREASFEGMMDSGNLLSDPLSGRRVMICELGALDGLIDPATAALIRSGGPVSGAGRAARISSPEAAKLRFIPASGTLGDGILCALTPESVTLTNEKNGRSHSADLLIAPVPRKLSADGCRALIPPGSLG